jgi:hypothetical protein
MQLISQKEAILLSNLYTFNNMQPGDEPAIGEQLTLQYKSYSKPKLIQEAENNITYAEQKEVTTIEPDNIAVKNELLKTEKNILDEDKAKKAAALLEGDKAIIEVANMAKEEKQIAVAKAKENAIVELKEEPKKITEPQTSEPRKMVDIPKKTYNEPHVSEDLKNIKKKFDQIVYQPLPEIKQPEPQKEPAKTEVKKDSVANITPPKQEVAKDSIKTPQIIKTKTGIERKVTDTTVKQTQTTKHSTPNKPISKQTTKEQDTKFKSQQSSTQKPASSKKQDDKKNKPSKKK